jgi:CBS domain-containing protein
MHHASDRARRLRIRRPRIAYGVERAMQRSRSKELVMRAQDLMTDPIVSCHVNDTLHVAAMLMSDHDCGTVAVVRDDGSLAGIVTDRDIAMASYTRGRPLDEMLVNSAMSKHVISARPEQWIEEIEQLMCEHQIRRIPIVDAENRPIGILSLDDLAVESVQPDTEMRNGPLKVAHVLAAICEHRPRRKVA